MKERKKRGGKGSKALLVVGGVLVVLGVAVFGGTSFFSGVLDTYVGRGEMEITQKAGSEDWDTEYYKSDYATADEASAAAHDVTLRIAQEGITLLKNEGDALPLSQDALNVTVFGRRSVDTIFGGTGSGAGDSSQCANVVDALAEAGFNVNQTVADMYRNGLESVPVANNAMDDPAKQTYYIGEFPSSYYSSDITSSYASYGDAAIVVLGRQGGEGIDFCTDLNASLDGSTAMSSDVAETANYADGQHQLELSQEERDLIAHAEENFDTVIVVINSANVMELGDLQEDENVDSILWLSLPGSEGTRALAQILKGEVNPSGHTVDTWVADLTADPTFPNTAPQAYLNVDESNSLSTSYTIDYEEGIYVGYRYYETAAEEGVIDYDSAVVYPFGYGLSYTTFSQEIASVEEADGTIEVRVSVTNTGDVAGRDVVQVYYSAPYDGSVEKSSVALAGFAKTALLEPGETQEYAVSFDVDDMASYDYKTEGCYVLDAGDYTISVRKNSHELYGENCEYTYTVADRVVYDESNPRPSEVEAQTGDAVNLSDDAKAAHEVVAATNRFDDVSARFVEYDEATDGMAVNLTREDFEASFPTAPTEADLTASDEVIADLGAYEPDYLDSADEMPTTEASNGVSAVALRGLTYDDPQWEALLDELSVSDMTSFIYAGNQGTVSISSVNLPASKASDGPAGLKQYGGVGLATTGNFNCSSTLTAATYNISLAEEYGRAVGNEALWGEVNGWYAPGVNVHRDAFGGRNFEYYSEDPLISGLMCGSTIQGASKMGLICYPKHFAINDQELHRTDNGYCTWANEQAMREIYLRAFEIALETPTAEISYLDEEGNALTKTIRSATGVMSSFNRIGSTWAGGSDALLKGVLRDEWGFAGTVITDYNGVEYMNVEWGVSSGNDLMLANSSTLQSRFKDTTNASTVRVMREAMKNCLYTLVNSSTVIGTSTGTQITYALAPWQIAAWAATGVLCVGGAVLIVLGIKRKEKKGGKKVVEVVKTDTEKTAEK